MGHVRRFALGTLFIFATLVLGLIIDAAAYPILEMNFDRGVDDGVFAPVLSHIEGAMNLIVPMLLLGISLWLVWGSIQEERQEEERTRVR